MLGLIRNLTANGRRTIDDIEFVVRADAESHLEQIGGKSAKNIRRRALAVERAIYSIGASLIPPDLEQIGPPASEPYQPFEVIRDVKIDWLGSALEIRPLIILDDVHTLHPEQFDALFKLLARREIKIGRWMMMRMDALSPSSVFQSSSDMSPGLKPDRDFIDVFMQGHGNRSSERRQFRRMAADMADRYLRLVPSLRDRNFTKFDALLSSEEPRLSDAKMEQLRQLVNKTQKSLDVIPKRRNAIDKMVADYAKSANSHDVGEDVQLGMARVLLNRYANRIENQMPLLFDNLDHEPRTPLKADSSVADAARIHLHSIFERPLHYGLNALCDASNENAELFLQLAGSFVSRMETKAIRNLDPALTPHQQQNDLSAKAKFIIDGWTFPFARQVKALVTHMAEECEEITCKENARLGAGANAFGIPEHEMDELLESENELALVLKFAVAYGALTAIRNYGQGGKDWCLLELSGPVCLQFGLTLKRGGFLESRITDLMAVLDQQWSS
jgi:hypothetical protein